MRPALLTPFHGMIRRGVSQIKIPATTGINFFPAVRYCNYISSNWTAISCQQRMSFSQYPVLLAGHSKWQNIKHIKMTNDAKKQAIRSKLAHAIRVAIREGGGSPDPKLNSKLASVIEIARANQVPNENIQRMLADSKQAKELKPATFAVKGPAQSVIIAEVETDNTNRCRQEITAIAKKKQCSFSDVALVLYQFRHVGVILCSEYNGKPASEDLLDEAVVHAIEAGAEEVSLRDDIEHGTVFEFTTDAAPSSFYPVISALGKFNYKVVYSEAEYIALNPVELSDDQLEAVSYVCDKLMSHQEVVRVFDNIA